jgi:hypothetical protein
MDRIIRVRTVAVTGIHMRAVPLGLSMDASVRLPSRAAGRCVALMMRRARRLLATAPQYCCNIGVVDQQMTSKCHLACVCG